MLYLRKIMMNNEERTMNTTTLNRKRLIECRKKLGITKQQAAIRMQLSQPAYLRYESGERTPSIHVIYYMAHILGTSADYLTGKSDDPTPNCHYIFEEETPELFTLIDNVKNCDPNTQKRLMAYFQKMSEQEEA
jgi:transcriptional regulator with XRE-family HTH domain